MNADDFWGGNALLNASFNGQVDIVKLLLAHGADPNMDDDGATAQTTPYLRPIVRLTYVFR